MLDWKEVDLSQNDWLLPKRRAKNNVPIIARSDQAIRMFDRLPLIKCEVATRDEEPVRLEPLVSYVVTRRARGHVSKGGDDAPDAGTTCDDAAD